MNKKSNRELFQACDILLKGNILLSPMLGYFRYLALFLVFLKSDN
jgi:hypothetical protein